MNLFILLKEHVGMNQEEAESYFAIEEQPTEWVLTARRWLEMKTNKAMWKLLEDQGGRYEKNPPRFYIPKTELTHGSIGVATPTNVKLETALGHVPPISESTEDYALSKSMKGKLGQLVPCLEDAEGIVFDGLHRKRLDPKAWTVKIDRIKTPVDRALARMTVNFCRRHYTSEEMKDDIGLLIGSGFSVEQIVDVTGISERTIYRYRPEELKDKVKSEAISQGKLEAQTQVEKVPAVTSLLKIQDTPVFQRIEKETLNEIVECASCRMGVHNSKAILIDDKYYCPQHVPKVKPIAKIEPTPFKPKESWEHCKATMQVQHSKLEMDLLTELSSRGITPHRDYSIPLWSTEPDGAYPEKKLVYYVHGEPHDKGKALERDDEIKAALEKDGWNVLVFRHGEGSVKEWADQVQEALKW